MVFFVVVDISGQLK